MEIAKQIAGFTLFEAEDLRRAISKKDHKLMASLKTKFIEGCITNAPPSGLHAAVGRHGEVAGLLVQQVARRLLRADRLPDRLAAREPRVRVHGGADLVGDEHEGSRAVLRQRLSLDEVVRRLKDALGLITFFTAGEKETRAWTLRDGETT